MQQYILLYFLLYKYEITKNNIKQYVASSVIKCFAHKTGYECNKSSSGIASSKYKTFVPIHTMYSYLLINIFYLVFCRRRKNVWDILKRLFQDKRHFLRSFSERFYHCFSNIPIRLSTKGPSRVQRAIKDGAATISCAPFRMVFFGLFFTVVIEFRAQSVFGAAQPYVVLSRRIGFFFFL